MDMQTLDERWSAHMRKQYWPLLQTRDYISEIADKIGDDDDMIEYLSRLEEISDDSADDELVTAEPVDPEGLVDEVEQFLRDQD